MKNGNRHFNLFKRLLLAVTLVFLGHKVSAIQSGPLNITNNNGNIEVSWMGNAGMPYTLMQSNQTLVSTTLLAGASMTNIYPFEEIMVSVDLPDTNDTFGVLSLEYPRDEYRVQSEARIDADWALLHVEGFHPHPEEMNPVHSIVTGANNYLRELIVNFSNEVTYITSTVTTNNASKTISIEIAAAPYWTRYELYTEEISTNYYWWNIPGNVYNGMLHLPSTNFYTQTNNTPAPQYFDTVTGPGAQVLLDNPYINPLGEVLPDISHGLKTINFPFLKNAAKAYGLYFEGTTSIKLNGSTMKIRNPLRYGHNSYVTDSISEYQIVYVGKGGTVLFDDNGSGSILDGTLTVVAEGDVRIREHLKYNKDPLVQNSDDMLLVIVRDDIWIDTTAPDNLILHGAFIAKGSFPNNVGEFGVLDYDQGSPRGNISLLGSAIANQISEFGTINPTNGFPITGYTRNFIYDPRFKTDAPPYCPRIKDWWKIIKHE